jgi:hypothetical protein
LSAITGAAALLPGPFFLLLPILPNMLNDPFYFMIVEVIVINKVQLKHLPKSDSSTYEGLETTDFFDLLESCDFWEISDLGYKQTVRSNNRYW